MKKIVIGTTPAKITKIDRFDQMITLINDAINSGMEIAEADDLIAFCENEKMLLEKKSTKAKESAAAKKSEKDELCRVVESLLTEDWQTRDEITSQIEGDDISVAKIGHRLTKLVNLGVAEKTEVSIPGENKTRRVVAYRAIQL